MINDQTLHIPVLANELMSSLAPTPDDIIVDATAGYGGHASLFLEKILSGAGKIVLVDQDPRAVRHLEKRFAENIAQGKVVVILSNFSNLLFHLKSLGLAQKISVLYADLGVSSPQLDQASRGFSFRLDAPLDMRMDQSNNDQSTASDLINQLSVLELTEIFRNFGEDPKAHAIARLIERERQITPITRTLQLADLIASHVHYATKSRTHPATRVFQALRIAVNKELSSLEKILSELGEIMAPRPLRTRVGFISFHSLEDRIVKKKFVKLSEKTPKIPYDLRHLPIPEKKSSLGANSNSDIWSLYKTFPILPSEEEEQNNPRARSAKLRVIYR